ncbi:guanine nucleotide exchange factor MSS4 homolog [Anopheles maculipalpis]|uniref:guanine nucleotide exchange factor MSS4 homolog n=1 Tax=Anopheles maculipalpis TaxID=1496333 RepID=UPI002159862E|nr:guanine nucleotide exchange factor MSS4 homolog [Anopheles maculipalpis]
MSSESPTPADYSTLIGEDGKNKTNVKCLHCGSLILKPANSDFDSTEFNLPMAKQKRQTAVEKEEGYAAETLKDFWMVKDMYTFENIGFSNTVDNRKYLTCADCEVGPIGYHDLETKKSYIALARVLHV